MVHLPLRAKTCIYIYDLKSNIITLKFNDVLDVLLLAEFDGICLLPNARVTFTA